MNPAAGSMKSGWVQRSAAAALVVTVLLVSTASRAAVPDSSSGPASDSSAVASPPEGAAPAPGSGPPANAGAQGDAAAQAAAPGSAAKRSAWPQPTRGDLSKRINTSVARLARKLNLDEVQQQKLRMILLEQHARQMALRNSSPTEQSDVAGSTLAIYDQTRERIRGILNEDQKKKYFEEMPRGELAPAQADLQHWLDVRDGRIAPAQTADGAK